MTKVKDNRINMKPRWYFILGSVLVFAGLIGSSIGAIFLTNISLFLLRSCGNNSQWKLQLMLESFPWWVPLLAATGTLFGIRMLKKFDFSYKKNFLVIVIGFVVAILLAALLIDRLGLNDTWSRQGPMRRFYKQIEGQNFDFQRGRGRMLNGKNGGIDCLNQ